MTETSYFEISQIPLYASLPLGGSILYFHTIIKLQSPVYIFLSSVSHSNKSLNSKLVMGIPDLVNS